MATSLSTSKHVKGPTERQFSAGNLSSLAGTCKQRAKYAAHCQSAIPLGTWMKVKVFKIHIKILDYIVLFLRCPNGGMS